ncbi:MAG: class I SAM-dependent methyltransferase [Actinomycetota bacterium]
MRDPQLYETISSTYSTTRTEDPRVAAQIHAALGGGRQVLNIGAGTGNYEPSDRPLTAVEPSAEMIAKRAARPGDVVRAAAESLPFTDGTFDVAMATLTLHHWTDRQRGLLEMRRVSARQVIFMFDPVEVYRFWAVDYWPEAVELPSERDLPAPADLAAVLGPVEVETVAVPIDCSDGFGAAFWGRPEAYLDPAVQQGMSWLAQLPAEQLAAGTDRLEADLRSGAWDERHGHLRGLDELDVGYRLVIAGTP